MIAPFTLATHEVAASEAPRLSARQQQALVAALFGRLARERNGWRAANGQMVPAATVKALVRDGLLLVVFAKTSKPQARLTLNGDWYARTLVTRYLGDSPAAIDHLARLARGGHTSGVGR